MKPLQTIPPEIVKLPQLSESGETPTIVVAEGCWDFETEGAAIRATAPVGFVYDGASIPFALRGIVSPDQIAPTALLHDILYRKDNHRAAMIMQGGKPLTNWQWTKEDADELFCVFMKRDNAKTVNMIERRLAFRAVDIFGESSYQTPESQEWAARIAAAAVKHQFSHAGRTRYRFPAVVESTPKETKE